MKPITIFLIFFGLWGNLWADQALVWVFPENALEQVIEGNQKILPETPVWALNLNGNEATLQIHTSHAAESTSDKATMLYRARLNWHNATALTPYVDAGIGAAQSDSHLFFAVPRQPSLALQGGDQNIYEWSTGALWTFSPAWEMEVAYHYFATEDAFKKQNSIASLGEKLEDKVAESSLVQVGVTFKF